VQLASMRLDWTVDRAGPFRVREAYDRCATIDVLEIHAQHAEMIFHLDDNRTRGMDPIPVEPRLAGRRLGPV
jgi:hypothetical protein